MSRLQRAWWSSDIPETRSGRREGSAVDRVLGQMILRKVAWDRFDMLDELASDADNSPCVTGETWRGLRRLSSRSQRHGLTSPSQS